MKKELAQEVAGKINEAAKIGNSGMSFCKAYAEQFGYTDKKEEDYFVMVISGGENEIDKECFITDPVFDVCKGYERLVIMASLQKDEEGKIRPALRVSQY